MRNTSTRCIDSDVSRSVLRACREEHSASLVHQSAIHLEVFTVDMVLAADLVPLVFRSQGKAPGLPGDPAPATARLAVVRRRMVLEGADPPLILLGERQVVENELVLLW